MTHRRSRGHQLVLNELYWPQGTQQKKSLSHLVISEYLLSEIERPLGNSLSEYVHNKISLLNIFLFSVYSIC